MRRVAVWACIVAMAILSGCASEPQHPAVTVIEDLLQLRRADSRNAEDYAPYFLESSLATALAEGSGEPTGTPRVPEWEQPYLSEETTSKASVVVVWKVDPAFEEWPAVNVFSLELVDERWLVVDAIEATSAPEPVDSGSDR